MRSDTETHPDINDSSHSASLQCNDGGEVRTMNEVPNLYSTNIVVEGHDSDGDDDRDLWDLIDHTGNATFSSDSDSELKSETASQEQLSLLRKVLCTTQGPDKEYTDEIIATPPDSVEELEGLCQRLEGNAELSKKMIYYLSSLGGSNLRDSVRRMMKWLGTKRLWSQYSLKGRKGKKAFQNFVICRVLIKACQKNNGKTKEMEVEEAISDTLKYAPNQRGGIKKQGT